MVILAWYIGLGLFSLAGILWMGIRQDIRKRDMAEDRVKVLLGTYNRRKKSNLRLIKGRK